MNINKHLLTSFSLFTLIIAISCGGSAGKTSISTSQTVLISGKADFSNTLAKTQFAPTAGRVTLLHIASSVEVEVVLATDGSFSANVEKGSFEITAVSSAGKVVKMIMAKVESDQSNTQMNLKTTAVASYVSSLVTSNLSELDETQLNTKLISANSVMDSADSNLTDSSQPAEVRSAAMVMLSLVEKVKSLNQSGDPTQLYTVSSIKLNVSADAVLSSFSDEAVKNVISRTQKVVHVPLSSGTLSLSTSAEVDSQISTLSSISLSVANVNEGVTTSSTSSNTTTSSSNTTTSTTSSSNTTTSSSNTTTPTANQQPTANAGVDINAWGGNTVTLIGTSSSDPEGSNLTYLWTQTSGNSVTLSSNTSSSPTFTAQTNIEQLTFSLTVNDGSLSSSSDSVVVSVQYNAAPTANAGNDQSAWGGNTVSLSGTSSSDPEGASLTFLWVQTSGTAVTLSSNTSSTPTFTAPSQTSQLDFKLTVNDGSLSSISDNIVISVTYNHAPVANAGSDQTLLLGSTVLLSASASSDSDGDSLTYFWSATSIPTGSSAGLSATTTASSSFNADIIGTYIMSVTVSDGSLSSSDNMIVNITNNNAPTANAGSDQTVNTSATVTLDGTASSDPEGVALTYLWTETSGTNITLSSNTTSTLSFTAPSTQSTLTFSLIVSDGVNTSTSDTVTIIASETRLINDFTNPLKIISNSNRVELNVQTNSLGNAMNVSWGLVDRAVSYSISANIINEWAFSVTGFTKFDNIFLYDASVSGYNYSGNIWNSSLVTSGKTWQLTVSAQDSHGNTVATSRTESVLLGTEKLDAPDYIWAESLDQSCKIEFTTVSGVNGYRIYYSSDSSSIESNYVDVAASSTGTTISSLQNGTTYYSYVKSLDSNAKAGFASPAVNVTPSVSESLDFSIESVSINQGVQIDLTSGTNISTPLIADKNGLLRVFTRLSGNCSARKTVIKLVGERFGTSLSPIKREVIVRDTPMSSGNETLFPIYFDLPDTWLKAGTNIHLEIDPDNTISETNESNNRFPASGNRVLDFITPPTLKIKLVPITTLVGGNVDISGTLLSKMETHLRSMYPNNVINITTHSTTLDLTAFDVPNNGNGWSTALTKLDDFRTADKASDGSENDVFYFGLLKNVASETAFDSYAGTVGLAYTGAASNNSALSGIGVIYTKTIFETFVHELAHNHNRDHIDSSDEYNDTGSVSTNNDTNYPYNSTGKAYGRIGKMGYNASSNTLLSEVGYHDLMSYADRVWISDYTYKGIYDFQVALNAAVTASAMQKSAALNNKGGQMRSKGSTSILEEGVLVRGLRSSNKFKVTTIIPTVKINSNQSTNQTVKIVFANKSIDSNISFKPIANSKDQSFQFFIPSFDQIESLHFYENKILIDDIFKGSESLLKMGALFNLNHNYCEVWPQKFNTRSIKISKDDGLSYQLICNDGDQKLFKVKVTSGDLLQVELRAGLRFEVLSYKIK